MSLGDFTGVAVVTEAVGQWRFPCRRKTVRFTFGAPLSRELTMMIVLRLVHVLAGVFWAGTVFFFASFLLPSMRDAGPAAGAISKQLIVVRKYPRAILTIAILTVLSGFALYGLDISLSNGAFARSRSGMVYGLGGLAATLTIFIGFIIMTPTANKMAALGAAIQASGQPPTPEQAAEQGRLQKKMGMGTQMGAALLFIAVVCMAIGRYV